ncbi:hypothetical protein [Selenomonas sp. AB3002]|uniref:hypothetical protein n=1 Tax=Selenomonas sp. AB3002 TaxID=1392502 RepID=UPI000689B0A4
MAEIKDEEELKALYDASCKKVLSEKGIVAHILKTCVEEYEETTIEEIIECIQGKPDIDKILVQDVSLPTRVGSEQTEDASDKEGTIFYDIRFTATVPSSDDEVIELIINLEAQNDFHPGYPLLKRGVYYCARMISSQYGTVFVQSDYGKIKKVYSIWICTNPSQEREYTITSYKMTEENIEGGAKAKKKDYDLLDVVMVCLGQKKYNELTGLLSMLNMVLKDNYLSSAEKREKLENEFKVEITPELEKGVADMCNLSAGIERQGIDKGKTEIVLEMLKENQPLDFISRVSKYSKEKIEEIARLNGVSLTPGT